MAASVPRISRTLELRYELAGTHRNATVAFYPETKIGKLVDHIKAKKNVSDIAVYSGDQPLSPTKTFGDYNIGAGATLTVKKFYTLPPSSPEEDE